MIKLKTKYFPPSMRIEEVQLEQEVLAGSIVVHPTNPNDEIFIEDWKDKDIDSNFEW